MLAITIGLVVANLFKGAFPILETSGLEYEAKSSNFMDTIVNIFPSNMWSAFVSANMLQVIVIALLFGAGILVAGNKASHAKSLMDPMTRNMAETAIRSPRHSRRKRVYVTTGISSSRSHCRH